MLKMKRKEFNACLNRIVCVSLADLLFCLLILPVGCSSFLCVIIIRSNSCKYYTDLKQDFSRCMQ